MPLLDQFGNPLSIKPVRRYKRSSKPRQRRVPSRATETARRNLAPATHVELVLAAKHNISGTQYGPGKVIVPLDVASVLREGEQRAAASDHNFSSTRACVIGPGRVKGGLSVTEVAPEYFDTQYMGAVPFGVVDRRTAVFTPY